MNGVAVEMGLKGEIRLGCTKKERVSVGTENVKIKAWKREAIGPIGQILIGYSAGYLKWII